MKGIRRFLRKELVETVRTWRLPVVAGVALFFAISGPILAELTPQLLGSLTQSQPGVVIQIPDPTYLDAYAQWIKNLSQIMAIVVIVLGAGGIAGEVASGTAALVLTKPVSRVSFVAAKAATQMALVGLVVVLGTALTQLITLGIFGEAPPERLWAATGVWLVHAAVLVGAATLTSAALPTLAAAGVGVLAMFVLSLASLWGPLVRYSPAGLVSAPSDLLTGRDPALLWPIVTGVALALALVGLAALVFSRREL